MNDNDKYPEIEIGDNPPKPWIPCQFDENGFCKICGKSLKEQLEEINKFIRE